jgi:hypothetical protein
MLLVQSKDSESFEALVGVAIETSPPAGHPNYFQNLWTPPKGLCAELEQRIDKRRYGATTANDDEDANEQQHNNDWKQPPFFALFHELK